MPGQKVKKSATIENTLKEANEMSSSSSSTDQNEFHGDDSNYMYEEPDNHDTDCEDNCREVKDETEIKSTINEEEKTSNTDSNTNENNPQPVMTDKSVQVTTDDLSISLSSFIKSEKHLITMCNIQSFSVLNNLSQLVDRYLPKETKCILNTRDCIILTTAKLNLDIPFDALGVFFHGISVVTVRNIFYDTVKRLARILEAAVSRVSKEEIECNMPKCFNKFQSTTSVLDCIEIDIQQPKCLKCRKKFYSHYKGEATVKFMTEVTPGGLIVGVSEPFSGSTSNRSIFNHTGTLKHLKSSRDAIMVSNDFLIDNECSAKGIKVFRPTFSSKDQQLTEEDERKNKDIAYARAHIDQLNQRIKQFKILSNEYPWHMIDYIHDVFLICCGLVNLGTPILSDDKF